MTIAKHKKTKYLLKPKIALNSKQIALDKGIVRETRVRYMIRKIDVKRRHNQKRELIFSIITIVSILFCQY